MFKHYLSLQLPEVDCTELCEALDPTIICLDFAYLVSNVAVLVDFSQRLVA